jgi:copper resistance protein D
MEISGWDVAVVAAKAITYAATLGAAGGVFFLTAHEHSLPTAQRTATRRLIGILLLVALLTSAARIFLLLGSMSGDITAMFDLDLAGMMLGGGEGRATGLRIAGLILAACALSTDRRLRWPALIGAILAATSFASLGHIHALKPNTLPTLLSCLHLLCAAFWLGALMPLLLLTRAGDLTQCAAIAARFGKHALVIVALLVAAGFGLLWILSYDTADFWGSAYARLILVKLLLVALLIGVAGINKLSLTPQLSRGEARGAVWLRRSVQVEIALALFILLVTASFTTLTGPPH